MIFYTSDSHFDHANIIRLCRRPFASVEEMNETLIANWNRKVGADDTVYILGDLLFRSNDPASILSRLSGHKHLILGNHDGQWKRLVDLEDYFESVSRMEKVRDGGRRCLLCHYPMVMWDTQECPWMIHGHIHNDTRLDLWPWLAKQPNILNAGVEINGYEPVVFDELVEHNKKFKAAWAETAPGACNSQANAV